MRGVVTLVLTGILFLATVQAMPAFAQSNACELLLAEEFSTEALDALKAAQSSGDMPIRVLRHKRPDGKSRLLVVLGEGTFTSTKTKELKRQVLRHFKVRGKDRDSIVKSVSLKVLGALQSLVRPISRLFQGHALGMNQTHSGTRRFFEEIAQNLHLRTMPRAALEQVSVQFNGQLTMTGEQVLAAATGAKRKTPSAEDIRALEAHIMSVDLEAGHKPDLVERLMRVYIPGMITVCAAAVCGTVVTEHLPQAVVHAVNTSALAFGARVTIGGQIVNRFERVAKAWWAFVIDPLQGFSVSRAKTIARNIENEFSDHADGQHMIVVVNRRRLPTMIETLTAEKHGFEEVPLNR